MDTSINEAFPVENDQATAELFEQQQRELNKYVTRFVYLPFLDGICSQVPGGYVPAGVIHPMPAPKGKANLRMLPEGAQILQVVSPSEGVPGATSQAKHKDPEYQKLLDRIEQMEKQQRKAGMEPASVAIYLLETAPIVGNITSVYGREGAIEVVALRGMPAHAFEHHRINDLIFGAERPATLAALVKRMQAVAEQAKAQKGEAARILTLVADEIAVSAKRCETFCREHIRQRHAEMEDPQNDAPKRYSLRDIRALDLAEISRRYEYMERDAADRRDAQEAASKREERLLEVIQDRDDKLAAVLGDMAQVMKALPDALKTIANKSGK